jgi:hypothetical protein
MFKKQMIKEKTDRVISNDHYQVITNKLKLKQKILNLLQIYIYHLKTRVLRRTLKSKMKKFRQARLRK